MKKLSAASAALLLCLLVTGATSALAAQAAPSRVSSEPEPGEELHEAPEQVSITFDQPLDPSSFIAVENHCGERVDDKDTEVTANEMTVDLTSKVSGTYHVEYFAKGVAGVTGAKSEAFTFLVHGGPSCDPDGGGHNGHGNGNGNGHGNGHGNGNGNGHGNGHGNGGGEHNGGGHSGNHENGGEHSGSGGHSGSTDHDDHDSMSDGEHADQDHGAHEAAENKPEDHTGHEENGIQNIAFGPAGPPLRGPDGPAVVIALSLSVVLGVLGGTVLRISAPK